MGLIPKTICKRCGKEFDEWRSRCPHCHARRVKASQRTTASTVSARPGTAAGARAKENDKWQKLLGGAIVALVILATLALVSLSLNARKADVEAKEAAQLAAQQAEAEQARAEAEAAEQQRLDAEQQRLEAERANAPSATSISISYYNQVKTEFSMNVGNQVPLTATVFPLDVTAEVVWSSSNESILTVSPNGVVTGVSSGWASVLATCGDVTAECKVWVK